MKVTEGNWKQFRYMVTSNPDSEFIILTGPRETINEFSGRIPILEESTIDIMFECVGTWPEPGEMASILLERLHRIEVDLDDDDEDLPF